MSGRESRRRQRKVRRQMMKDEVRCCISVFEEFIYNSESKARFIDREYNRPTWDHTPQLDTKIRSRLQSEIIRKV